jgi:hypothetical protein
VLTLKEESRLRVSGNWVLRKAFGPNRDKVEEWRNYTLRTLIICTPH